MKSNNTAQYDKQQHYTALGRRNHEKHIYICVCVCVYENHLFRSMRKNMRKVDVNKK